MPESLTTILPHIPAFMMVLFRLTGIFVFAPMFGSSLIPVRVKVLFALTLSFCIYPLIPPQAALPLSMLSLAPAIASELAIGAIIGFGASLPLSAMQLGGTMMGLQLGMGLAQVYNPDFNEETEVISQLLMTTALTIFIILDGHHVLLGTLIDSFKSVPLGGYKPDGQVLSIMLGLLTAMLELGIRVAAPLLCLVFLESVAMGFVAKTVPQLNILTIGFPLRIIIGMMIFIATLATINESFIASVRDAMNMLLRVIGT